LLTHNADPNLIDSSGNTALHHAISRGNIRIVKMLLEHNVDIEAKTEVKITQLHSQGTSSSDTHIYFLHTEAHTFSLNLFRGTLLFSPNMFFIFFGSSFKTKQNKTKHSIVFFVSELALILKFKNKGFRTTQTSHIHRQYNKFISR
jgi:ankyrin repeat protein